MAKFGLIGKTLKHSYSKIIHEKFGGYNYDLYEVEPKDLKAFVDAKAVTGYNVTIPYKKDVMPFLDHICDKAKEIGAVNTVVNRNGKLYGYNTDFDGMIYMLNRANIDLTNKVVMILGTGGTSNTAYAVAKSLGAKKIIVVSRTGEVNYSNCYEIKDVEVVINTTPVGMYPNVCECPIALAKFPDLKGVADVIYNPKNTLFIDKAKSLGVKTTSGLSMLVAQAKYAMELFLDKKVDDKIIEEVLNDLQKQTSNIVLIGMAGAGKSTVGQQVAEKLNKKFVDIDKEIERVENRSIPEIFTTEGEGYFRTIEKRLTQEFCKQTGQVIATGGGIVKDKDNRAIIRLNGVVYEIYRNVDDLATENRPLSVNRETVKKLYEERKELYKDFRDDIIVNDRIEEAVKGVIEKYENTRY